MIHTTATAGRLARAAAALAATALLAGCYSRPMAPLQPVVQVSTPAPGQSDNKVWARVDGQRMAGNPALTRQGQSDLGECRAQTEVSPGAKAYDLVALEACMNVRGYREMPRPG